MAYTIQIRRGTAAEWTSANPVLAVAEPGYETDTNKLKFGDGTNTWANRPYAPTITTSGGTVTIPYATAGEMAIGTSTTSVPAVKTVYDWANSVFATIDSVNTGGGTGAVTSVNNYTGDVVLYMDDLADIDITSPADGDVPVFDATINRFKNEPFPDYSTTYAPYGYTAPFTLFGQVLAPGDTVDPNLPPNALIIDEGNIHTGGVTPSDLGLLAWTTDPANNAGTTYTMVSGTMIYGWVPVRGDWTITKLFCNVASAGAGTTAGMAAYSPTGTLLGAATAITDGSGSATTFNATGVKVGTVNIARTFGQHVLVAAWYFGGTTAPQLSASGSNALLNNLSNPNSLLTRFGTSAAGAATTSTPPSSFGAVTAAAGVWFGIG